MKNAEAAMEPTYPCSGYPEAVNLPFNGAVIRDAFVPGTPDDDDPSQPGYWLFLKQDSLLVRDEGGRPALPAGELPPPVSLVAPPFLIGTWHGQPLRVAQVEGQAALPDGLTTVPVHFRESRLDDRLLTLAGLARQILYWKNRSVQCPACCTKLEAIEHTWGVRCRSCKSEYYPPIHPAVIVLVKRGEEFLLARQPGWPAGFYSPVAGFLEFGESLEECACREVREETGIRIRDVRYASSQHWPFPSQIMVGFTAEYAGGEIEVDTTELEDARWFSPDNIPPALSPRRSIARYLIDTFALKK